MKKLLHILPLLLLSMALAVPGLGQGGNGRQMKGKPGGHSQGHMKNQGHPQRHPHQGVAVQGRQKATYHNRTVRHTPPGQVRAHYGTPHHPIYRRRVVTYHPVWSPTVVYERRWVFCPRYNFYWDNYNNVYVYRSGGIWITSYEHPVYVDLSRQRYYEIQDGDAIDVIHRHNRTHMRLYLSF